VIVTEVETVTEDVSARVVSTESASDETTLWRQDSTPMVTDRTAESTESTTPREETTTEPEEETITEETIFIIPTGFLNEKSRPAVRTEAPTVAVTDKKETKPFSLISDDSTSSEPRVGTTTEFTTASVFDHTEDNSQAESVSTQKEALLTVEATTESKTEPDTACTLRCMSGSAPTAACDRCTCSRGRNYTLQIRDYNRNYLTRASATVGTGEVLGTANIEGIINIINTCYAQVTVSQSPVYKSQEVVLRYSKTRPVLSVYLESNRETRCPAASCDCQRAEEPECFRDSDCQHVNGKCCMSDCTHKCVSADGLTSS